MPSDLHILETACERITVAINDYDRHMAALTLAGMCNYDREDLIDMLCMVGLAKPNGDESFGATDGDIEDRPWYPVDPLDLAF